MNSGQTKAFGNQGVAPFIVSQGFDSSHLLIFLRSPIPTLNDLSTNQGPVEIKELEGCSCLEFLNTHTWVIFSDFEGLSKHRFLAAAFAFLIISFLHLYLCALITI